MIHKILSIFMVLNLVFLGSSEAQITSPFVGQSRGAEYFVGKEEGKPLITVNIVNGTAAAGIYHVPIDTNIAQLLSYAGGTVHNSELDTIQIRRTKSKDQVEFIEYDYQKLMQSNSPMPALMDKDVVNIPVSVTLEKTSQVMSILTGIAVVLISIKTLSQ